MWKRGGPISRPPWIGIVTVRPSGWFYRSQNAGYILDHIEGSHHYFTHPTDRTIHFSVPHHSGEMKRSTLAKILKQAKISLAEFLRHDP